MRAQGLEIHEGRHCKAKSAGLGKVLMGIDEGLQHKCDGCGHSFSTLQVLYIHASHSVHVCVAVCVIER